MSITQKYSSIVQLPQKMHSTRVNLLGYITPRQIITLFIYIAPVKNKVTKCFTIKTDNISKEDQKLNI